MHYGGGDPIVNLKLQVEQKLRSHGVKPTSPRTEIGALLFASPTHLSADQILNSLRISGSRVSKATVYNTLNLFAQHGLIREVSVDPTRQFYDSTQHAHHHFYNVDTGCLTDIQHDELEFRRLPALPPGTEAENIEVVVRVRNKTC
jgi:Fur family iron response transcriptional regulator